MTKRGVALGICGASALLFIALGYVQMRVLLFFACEHANMMVCMFFPTGRAGAAVNTRFPKRRPSMEIPWKSYGSESHRAVLGQQNLAALCFSIRNVWKERCEN